MTRVRCYECGTDTPAGSSFHVEDRVLCGHCADEQAVKRADAGLEVPRRTRVIDPTICEFCDADNGDTSLPLVAGMPACDACAARMRCHPFPGWLKGAAVVVILIVGVAFVRNWRFVVAHVEATRAVRAHHGLLERHHRHP